MRKRNAIKERAKWLAFCLSVGWDKSDLPALEKIWDAHKDEYANLRDIPVPAIETPWPTVVKYLKALETPRREQ